MFKMSSKWESDSLRAREPEGAFYAWADISEISDSSVDFCNSLLENQKVVAVAGIHFGTDGEGYIRLALFKPMDILKKGLDRIENYLNSI
jgi:aspartate/methionine/tyrosine aminotransferase